MTGRTLAGRYEILDQLGSGGMSVVYSARDRTLNRLVAVKILKPQWAEDDEVVRRFDQEARAAASLVDPHVVQVYDVGREPPDIYYMVMELVDGETLRARLDRDGRLSVQEALSIADQVAKGLEAAHRQKLVHRDIKPQNILIAKDGTVKVTDFGIAYAAASERTLVNTGSLMGTVPYLSPEQARGKLITAQSDLYSLGVVLFEMLVGKLPFEGDTAIGVAMKHLHDEAPDVRTLRAEVSEPVARIVHRALAKDLADRFQSASAFRQEIERALGGAGDSVPLSRRKAPQPVKRSRRWLVWTIVLVLLAGLAGGGYWSFSRWFNVATATVPDVRGQQLAQAQQTLSQQGLRDVHVVGRSPSDKVTKGAVLYEDPVPGTKVKVTEPINLVVSTGQPSLVVPDLVNTSVSQAEQTLNQMGLKPVKHSVASQQPAGVVIRQVPSANQTVKSGTNVNLFVSDGSQRPAGVMPSLWGMTVSQAGSVLVGMNLSVNTPTYTYSTLPTNSIIDQRPEPQTAIQNTAPVDVWVSQGPSPKSANFPMNTFHPTWNMPGSTPKASMFKVVVQDNAGNKEVYYRTVGPGSAVRLTITWYGTTGEIRSYLNGQQWTAKSLSTVAGSKQTAQAPSGSPPSGGKQTAQAPSGSPPSGR